MVAPTGPRARPSQRKPLQIAHLDELPRPKRNSLGAEYPRGAQAMSFRSRLSLFFTIIVVVPMVAVALVLFSIMADSETGKTDAEIAQGLRAAFAVYDADRTTAHDSLHSLAGDPTLGRALATGDRAALRARAADLAGTTPGVRQLAVFDASRRELALAGTRDAVAAAVAAPSSGGRPVGFVAVSTTTADAFARQLRQLTGLDARIALGGRIAASTVPGDRGQALRSGDVRIGDAAYRARFASLAQPVGAPVAVGMLENRAALSSRIARRRELIGGILAGFLILALLSSIVVVRALQRQVNKFLEAARRLARGDFSRPVPVEGNDEFAALGREFNTMSQQLATKIEEVQRKRGELEETIRRVGEAFAAGLDRQEIVNIAVRTALEACEAEAGRALPIDRRRMKTARIGEQAPAFEAAFEAAERSAFAIHFDDPQDWIAAFDTSPDGEDISTDQRRPVRAAVNGVYALAVPLMARLGRGRSVEQVGVVSIARTSHDFDDAEYDLFAYLIGQAAISIENVDLHETVRVQAVTDELTGLHNLRHFHEALDAEIERSRRFGTDVGLVMLDIDDFKAINDTFGHQQGDLVLMEVGRVLRNLSRDIDVPARYGGEEMAVILPQTDMSGAALLADRMRRAVEALRIDRLEGGGSLSVTASFGVASLPLRAHDKESLIHEADAALYRAKRAGKNQVQRAEAVIAES
jgi:diguanylate cyclase (GGDEF)-like protein